MATRMLIDARHPEETRVAVLKGNRIEEFDFESDEHRQIKGNIYLAKVTRVEPSLQAAFVDFGGNRHGFLAFSEIHPDYYQIPAADRAALLAEEQAAADEEAALRDEEDDEDHADDRDDSYGGDYGDYEGVEEIDTSDKDHVSTIEDGHLENGDDAEDGAADSDEDDTAEDDSGEDGDAADDEDGEEEEDEERAGQDDDGGERPRRGRGKQQQRGGRRQGGRQSGGRQQRGGGDRAKVMDEVRARRQALRRRYKIQDVIQRRQVLLVQVVKEERGNKGAALTTYLSLAGRYCVLMPNSSHGGGISRKISSGADRKRLKQIVSEMTLPRSMGLIVRTAGLQRTKTEIKRDFDYLARLWDEIRERTLGSSAPALIHSDSDLIKRAIRDIYNREIEEVVVEGVEGFKSAKDFMKLLMPSHARRVKHYADPVPLFQRFGAEDQLSAMYDPVVQLKSGGYLVINPTEALVSIDINSGRSTREHGIEQTAVATNLEAAKEIARQLRLRDMAGLVVIDFIDMENNSNTRKVERMMKDSLKNDRARIQVGRISSFGLMEMSRQRLRTGVLEATTRGCPHCDGTGLVRTASSAGLSALRLIEDEAAKGKGSTISLYASTEAAVYLLNAKRADLSEIEHRYGVTVEVRPEGEEEGAKMRVASSGPRPTEMPRFETIIDYAVDDDDDIEEDEDEEIEERAEPEAREPREPRNRREPRENREPREAREPREPREPREGHDEAIEGEDDDARRKRRRRRRGGRGRNKDRQEEGVAGEEGNNEHGEEGADMGDDTADAVEAPEVAEADGAEAPEARSDDDEDRPRRRRRRGGRGRSARRDDEGTEQEGSVEGDAPEATEAAAEEAPEAEPVAEEAAEAVPAEKPKRRARARKTTETVDEVSAEEAPAPEAPTESAVAEEAPAKPKRRPRKAKAEAVTEGAAEAAVEAPVEAEAEAPAKPKRTRRKKADVEAEAPAAEPEAEAATAPETAPEPEAPAETAPAPAAEETPASDGPRRGGWWQRTFGA